MNCKTPLTYICKKHRADGEQTVTYDAFKNQNKFCCASCAKEHISDLHMTPIDEIKQIVEERAKILSKKSQQLWSMIINAACVFERKEQLLAEYFINEDF